MLDVSRSNSRAKPPSTRLWSDVRRWLWFAKQWLRRTWYGLLPPILTYRALVNLDWVHEAWPVRTSVFPTPYVYSPKEADRDLFDVHHFYSSRDVTLPSLWINAIPDGQIFVSSGLVADRQSRLILESAKGLMMIDLCPEFGSLRRLRPLRLDDRRPAATIMSGTPAANWYHWLVDSLARLYALGQVNEEFVLLIPPTLGPGRLKVLEWALPGNAQLKVVDSRGPVRCETVFFSPFATLPGCGLLRPEIADFLRAQIFKHVDLSAGKPFGKRIYTTRQFDDVRRVANEPELIAALEPLGFQVVYPGGMSLEDQVRCFAGAEIVVGAHGANLTGLLFSSGATAIELAPFNLCYWGVCTSAGNRHVSIPPVIEDSKEYLIPRHRLEASAEFKVDVACVVTAVEEAIASPA